MGADVPLDEEEFQRWRDEAERACRGARLQADAELHNWACFAAEQAAQLAVKGLLHGVGAAPWGHDLTLLAVRIDEAGLQLPDEAREAMRRLSRHYIPARYPDAHPAGPAGTHYGALDAAQALEDAVLVLRTVDRLWESLHA